MDSARCLEWEEVKMREKGRGYDQNGHGCTLIAAALLSRGCAIVNFKGCGEKAIRRRGRVSLLEVLFSRSCSRQSWLAWEQHKYTAVNISWPCNALNKQRAQFSSESSHTHWRRHACMRAGRHTPGETHIRTDM